MCVFCAVSRRAKFDQHRGSFTIIALFSVLSYYGFKSRIPLASLLLQVVIDVSKHHRSVYVVAFGALILQALLAV